MLEKCLLPNASNVQVVELYYKKSMPDDVRFFALYPILRCTKATTTISYCFIETCRSPSDSNYKTYKLTTVKKNDAFCAWNGKCLLNLILSLKVWKRNTTAWRAVIGLGEGKNAVCAHYLVQFSYKKQQQQKKN